ncbi:RraA family protein [Allobranchiibius huperziae]|uniref:Putative 4-hydroxy-4-methyl-2-oxoglutarate aldolase n=1 Tax=Allobranchiibius huperziae TaxID=1874116 RepID=A0A853DKJ7_9MICO|nr:RraA family protein [Allobranchiibius huperziae]NYJ76563.1 regulator of RNase E activity RraA [Allobranchiibius huperziae]
MTSSLPPIDTDLSDLLNRARKVAVPTLGHYLEAGFADPDLQRISGKGTLVGRAVTVRISATDSTALHHIVGLTGPGDVVVVDTGMDRRHAAVGEVVANAAASQGTEGIITDGPATDSAELQKLGLVVHSRGTSALTTKLHGIDDFSFGQTITCGGVAVNPGDIVLADQNGTLFVDPAVLTSILADAIQEDLEEPDLIRQLWAGARLGDLTGATQVIKEHTATATENG